MAIQHKFQEHDFGDGFKTHNAILDITPYKPEVMIIGTFNPNTPNDNFADFYYGRNFFWPAFKNLFQYNNVELTNRRMPTRGLPPEILNPTLPEILKFCTLLKLTFSDMIQEVFQNCGAKYKVLKNDNVVFNEQEFNLIQDGRKKEVGGLQQLNIIGEINWNTKNIIRYLADNPQIKQIYFTRQPTGIWATEWNLIINDPCMIGREATNIFTPSCAGAPVNRSMTRLLQHWVHNENQNFGQLDRKWLIKNRVNPNNF